ncbi:hypothetical protein BSIN_4493 [Burkholderia singularis]|uniref:Uncharacterized protein n=1 Tax=Burkholderia singularis TaxID=1503053 RepID=A0A238H832_9BURK|nr:hypothetical protein BSIN_4493 [Burkholderia singularis]
MMRSQSERYGDARFAIPLRTIRPRMPAKKMPLDDSSGIFFNAACCRGELSPRY